VHAVSSATGAGIEGLQKAIFSLVPPAEPVRAEPQEAEIAEHAVYRPVDRAGWDVRQVDDRLFRISGPAVERLVVRHDLENSDALVYIEERLRAMGVVKELEARGFEPGDEIEIGDVAFALYPGVPQQE
jgi:GTPase